MSETLVLVFPGCRVTVDDVVAWLGRLGSVTVHGEVITAEISEKHIYLVESDDEEVEEIFAHWPTDLIPDPPTAVFSLDYRSAEVAVNAVRMLAMEAHLIVDTNFHLVVPAEQLTTSMLCPRCE
ncbi:hypothetical protein ACFY4C_16145 [Actinomadura viridis]|uniref:hypothetical protein n=1 Tax=Actinomadura viridis TaxID=58110 RepID=UPI00369C7303